MKKMIVLGGLLLLAVVVVLGCTGTQECPKCPKCEAIEEQAEMFAIVYGWNSFSDFETEGYFEVDVVNFGYTEAKNVEITCEVYEFHENTMEYSETPDFTQTWNIGNIASTSYESEYFEVDFGFEPSEDASGECYVSSCDDCEILDERLPELN